jgi:hypothetical protein
MFDVTKYQCVINQTLYVKWSPRSTTRDQQWQMKTVSISHRLFNTKHFDHPCARPFYEWSQGRLPATLVGILIEVNLFS